jgi:two-component system sensor histidine kinase YesM
MMILRNIMKKISDLSYFLKLVITYSILIAATIGILFYVQLSYFIPIMQNDEIKFELQAYNKLAAYTDSIYNKVLNDVLLGIYTQNDIIDSIKKVDQNPGMVDDPDIAYKINTYLRVVCGANSEVLSIVIITNRDTFYQGSYNEEGLISPSYDFSKDILIRTIKQSSAKPYIVSDSTSRYSINGGNRVMTFIGNLSDTGDLRNPKSIGVFMVNISVDSFKNSYRDIEGSFIGDLFVLNNSGDILFSSQDGREGDRYPYFEKVRNVDNGEVLLDKASIVRTRFLGNGQLMVLNTLPKDFAWNKLSGLRKRMITLLLFTLILGIGITALISSFFNKRIKTLVKFMKKVQNGRLDERVPVTSMDEVGELSAMFNEMCQKLSEYIQRVYFAEIERKNSELSVLQAQINPHFLYNTLESIKMKALMEDQPEISKMISSLGSLFRWSVKTKDKFVAIDEELDYISSYLDLIQFRYGNKLEIRIEFAEDILDLEIPKLLLQPIVENSVIHGIEPSEGLKCIYLSGKRIGDIVEISVYDNGVGMSEEDLSELISGLDNRQENTDYYGIGVRNVHQRIRLIFGNEYGLDITSKVDAGTTVHIRIPAIKKEEVKKYV